MKARRRHSLSSLFTALLLIACLLLACGEETEEASPEDFDIGGGTIGILAYHRVIPLPGWGHVEDVSQAKFRSDLDYLRSEGYTFLTTRDLVDGSYDPEGKNVLITVDDGRLDNFTMARPILNARGIKATFFVPTIAIGWDTCMDWDQLGRLVLEGHRVESHGVNHADLTDPALSNDTILDELVRSKEILEAGIPGPYEVVAFAYPFGYNDERTVDILESYGGYRFAITIDPGGNDPDTLDENRFQLRRFEVHEDFPIEAFFHEAQEEPDEAEHDDDQD